MKKKSTKQKSTKTNLVSVGYFMGMPLYMMIQNNKNPVINQCRNWIKRAFKTEEVLVEVIDLLNSKE